MERGGDAGAFCWIRPIIFKFVSFAASFPLVAENWVVKICQVHLDSLPPATTAARQRRKTKETVSAGVWGHRAFQASQGPACKWNLVRSEVQKKSFGRPETDLPRPRISMSSFPHLQDESWASEQTKTIQRQCIWPRHLSSLNPL